MTRALVSASSSAGYTSCMRRRWPALAVVAAVAVTPLLAACGDDDDAPADPTVTLFEGTANPNVSTDITS